MVRGARSVIPEFTASAPLSCGLTMPATTRARGREEMGTMQFGVMLPHRWLYAAGNTIADFAREAEALGYTSLWVTDHIIVPSTGRSAGTSSMRP